MGACNAAVSTYLALYAYAVAAFSVAGAGLVVSLSGAVGILARDSYPALLLLGAVGIGAHAVAWQSVVNTVVVRQVASDLIGPASGYPQLGFHAGLVVAPVAAGAAAEWTGTYGVVWAGALALSLAAATCAIAWGGRPERRRRSTSG